jgi:hypothetical protein
MTLSRWGGCWVWTSWRQSWVNQVDRDGRRTIRNTHSRIDTLLFSSWDNSYSLNRSRQSWRTVTDNSITIMWSVRFRQKRENREGRQGTGVWLVPKVFLRQSREDRHYVERPLVILVSSLDYRNERVSSIWSEVLLDFIFIIYLM